MTTGALSADEIMDRLKEALEAPSDGALAKRLGVGRMTVSNWRRRDSRPYPFCIEVALREDVSLDWLLLGRGPMRRSDVELAVRDEGPKEWSGNGDQASWRRLRQIQQWEREWWFLASEEERIWYDLHLRRTVLEYAAWIGSRTTNNGAPPGP